MTTPPIADTLTAAVPLLLPLGERLVRAPSTLSGVVVFAPEIDRTQHAGRHAVRQSVLAMPSAEPGRIRRPRTPTGRGVFWGVSAANGVTLALSADDFPTIHAALDDADRLFYLYEQLTFRPRRASANSTAFWVELDGRVVLLSGGTYKNPNGERRLRRALRAAWLPGADSDPTAP